MKELENIAKIVLANIDKNKSNEIGLFQGDAGICLFLYNLNKKLRKQFVEKCANGLIDKICNNITINISPTFDSGAAGIGWGINYLIQNKFCVGDVNDILMDIDAFIFQEVNKSINIPINISNGLVGYLIYSVSRLQNGGKNEYEILFSINKSLFRNIIDRVDRMMPSVFPSLTKDLNFSILGVFPILIIYLKKALELNIYNNKIENMINGWMFYFNTSIPSSHINRLYLAVAFSYLNEYMHSIEVKKQIAILMYSIDFKTIKSEIDPAIMNINEGWFSVVLIMKKAEELIDPDCPNYSYINDTRVEIIK